MLNGAVGYQLLDDGTAVSIGLLLLSSLLIFIGTGYIALDTGFQWTGYWDDTLGTPNQAYALYTLYQLVPLIWKPSWSCEFLESANPCVSTCCPCMLTKLTTTLVYLMGAAILFAIGQIFQYVISVHICEGTDGKINGGLFESLFTLLAVVMVWVFWSSITEDDWPMPTVAGSGAYN
jgi:hypothetical protein